MRAGGGGVTRLDISTRLPHCSRPLIENILLCLGVGAWGRGWERGQEGTESSQQGLCQGCCWGEGGCLFTRELGFSWECLGGRDMGFHFSSAAHPTCPRRIVTVGTMSLEKDRACPDQCTADQRQS